MAILNATSTTEIPNDFAVFVHQSGPRFLEFAPLPHPLGLGNIFGAGPEDWTDVFCHHGRAVYHI